MFRLARLSLANRPIIALLSLAIVGFGLCAVFSMKQELFPSLTRPAATVVTTYQGASPDIVDREVTKQVDAAVAGVDGVNTRTSTSSDNTSIVQVEFDYGTDMKNATRDLTDAVNRITPQLPQDVTPQVETGSTNDIPVVILAASADVSERELAKRLSDDAVPALRDVSGVRDVQVTGERTDRVLITLDPDKMKKKHVTADAVTQALQASGVTVPGGNLTSNGRTNAVQVGNDFASLDALRKLPILASASTTGRSAVTPPAQQNPNTRPLPRAAPPQGDPASRPLPTRTSPSPTPTATSPTPTPTPTPTATSPTPSPSSSSPTPTPTAPTTRPASQPPVPSGQPSIPGGQFPTQPGAFPTQPGAFPTQPGAFPSAPGQFPQVPGQQATPRPKIVHLSDIATVARQLAPSTSITRTDGKESLGIAVTKTTDANTVDVARAVRDKLGSIERSLGDGARLTVVFDQSPFITQSIDDLTTEGGVGLLFAVVVILLFLLSLRSTIVTALSIPFSLLLGVIGLYVGGYSFDLLTLGAMTVAVGRVVDDSIVVLENIKRHLGYGEEKRQAILSAVREVGGAVTASTLTTVGVFLPIAFVGGQVGELFRPFAVTVTVALLASLLVSLTIVPVLGYWFLKRRTYTAEEQERVAAAAVAKERRNPMQRIYVPVVRWTTRHRLVTVLAGVLILIATLGAIPLLQTNFLGSMGSNTYQVMQTMPVATSLGKTDAAAKKVEQVLRGIDGVDSYQVTIGSGQGFGPGDLSTNSNKATYSITSDENVDQTRFENTLRRRLDALTGVGKLTVGSGFGDAGASNIEVDVHAADEATLRTATDRVEAAVRGVPNTADVTSNLAADLPTIQVSVDRTKAAKKGLSEQQIGQAVRAAFEGQKTGTVVLGGDEYDVLVRPTSAPDSVAQMRDFKVSTPTGSTVRLADVADVHTVNRPAQITRTDGERTASVTATPTGTDTGAVSADVQRRLAGVTMPSGATWELGGVTTQQNDAFRQLLLAVAAAIAIVFIVMVATFRSIVQPLILLISIPFAATGAIGLLLATHIALGVPGMIGMLMLVGIVVTNAIVLIDLINQYRRQGMSVRDAVVEGGRRRLRPILMTAVATIFALLPMAFGLTGGGLFISQPLAIVVIGGLVTSTLLTLVLVPTLYTMIEGRKERRAQRAAAREEQRDPVMAG
jgi:hydrophobic/amphiphilic exporter-1 (mainly G- bacteria), HAE1 family